MVVCVCFCSADAVDRFCNEWFVYFKKVWSLEQPEWTCKIDEGSAGLIDVCWSPDSRHILTTADFHVCQNCYKIYTVLMVEKCKVDNRIM